MQPLFRYACGYVCHFVRGRGSGRGGGLNPQVLPGKGVGFCNQGSPLNDIFEFPDISGEGMGEQNILCFQGYGGDIFFISVQSEI